MEITIMAPGQEKRVSQLVNEVFDEFVAPGFVPEGITEFRRYVNPDGFLERVKDDHIVFVAQEAGSLVGMIEIRQLDHISLFFVPGDRQRQGIGRALLKRALKTICRIGAPLVEITVNASPNAAPAYRTLGFVDDRGEQCVHGIRFVPMRLALSDFDLE